MPNTELHCDLIQFLISKGIPEDEVSGVLLEAGVNSMLAEDESHETIVEAVEMILEEDSDNGDTEE